MINKLYMNRQTRDLEAKRLIAEGYQVRKSSHRGQLLHPMYIEDYPRQLSEAEKGFGNTIYQTYFKVLYSLDTN